MITVLHTDLVITIHITIDFLKLSKMYVNFLDVFALYEPASSDSAGF